jgi:integrase/recombinase XerD
MLITYRRHEKRCAQRPKGRKHRHCKCPVWMDGYVDGVRIHKSLNTRDWEKGQRIVREWEAEGEESKEPEAVTIVQACEEFLRDATARNLREPTLYKYRLLFRRLHEFSQSRGIRLVRQLDLTVLRDFRASWPNRNIAARKKLEALRTFMRFCWESGWIPNNPASILKHPKTTDPPTVPFTPEEIAQIFAASEQYYGGPGQRGRNNAYRLRALVLLLLYSGLRIRDAVTLSNDRILNGKLLLYTAKTGTPVFCPLPPFVVAELEKIRPTNSQHFFWSGESKPKSSVGDWQRSLKKLFRSAGVPDGHAHRFRHTFATNLLLAGVPLDRVATLLGHTNSKITEKHYAPWVRARQEQLEEDVRHVWDQLSDKSKSLTASGPVSSDNQFIN